MTHTLRVPQTDIPPQAGRPMLLPALVQSAHPADVFCTTVPDAGLDVILLFHDARTATAAARYQVLLRAFCAMQKTVSRAAMHEDRIELQIDEARLAIGDADLSGQPEGTFFRPDMPRPTPNTARIAYFVQHHTLALRLRVGHDAPEELCDDICQLMVALHKPKAVILTETRIALSLSEFEQRSALDLAALRKGASLPAVPMRYSRPDSPAESTRPSPFAPGKKATSAVDSRRAERIATSYYENKQDKALSRVFRSTVLPIEAQARHSDLAPDPFCDAVVFQSRHFRLRVLTSLLVATMLLVAPAAQGIDAGQMIVDLPTMA